MTFKHNIVLGVTASLLANTMLTDIKIDFIKGLNSDTGLSALRSVEIATEGVSAAGDMSGERLAFVSTDTDENITEGVKAYEYLAEAEEVDLIISGSIGDVNLGQLPHMQEFQIPTLDTWTSYIGIIDMVVEDPETMTPYFMNIAPGGALATLYINFGADVLKKEMGWDSVITLVEDTASSGAITDLVTEALGPVARVETKEIITYNIGTVDFALLFSKTQASGANFIYQVSSVNSQVISPQYVKLRVSMAMVGVNVSALGLEYREGADGAGGDISTLSPIPSVGFELSPESQKFVDTYQAKYSSRPKMPHFNGFNAYQDLERAVAAAKVAGDFDDAEAWSAEMKKQDITLKKDGEMWPRYTFQNDDEVEEVTGRTYPHNARFDLTAPYDDTQPSMVAIQWEEDGEVGVVYPPEYTTTKFTVPSWTRQLQACKPGCFGGREKIFSLVQIKSEHRNDLIEQSLSGGSSAVVLPDPVPSSETRRRSADSNVGPPHARVGDCQASNKTKGSVERLGLLFYLLFIGEHSPEQDKSAESGFERHEATARRVTGRTPAINCQALNQAEGHPDGWPFCVPTNSFIYFSKYIQICVRS